MQKDDKILISLGLFVVSVFIITIIFIVFPDYREYYISGNEYNASFEESFDYLDVVLEDYEYSDDIESSDVNNSSSLPKKENNSTNINLKEEDGCREKIKLLNGEAMCSDKRLMGLETDGTREDRKRMLGELAIDMRDSIFNNESLEPIFGDVSLGSRVCKIFLFESLNNGKDSYSVYFCDEEGIMIGKMRVDADGIDEDNIEYVRAVDYKSFLVSEFEIEAGLRINDEFSEEEEFPIPTEEITAHFKNELGDELEITSIRLVSKFNSLMSNSHSNIMYEVTVNVDGLVKKYYTNAYTNSTILTAKNMRDILQNEKEARSTRMPD